MSTASVCSICFAIELLASAKPSRAALFFLSLALPCGSTA